MSLYEDLLAGSEEVLIAALKSHQTQFVRDQIKHYGSFATPRVVHGTIGELPAEIQEKIIGIFKSNLSELRAHAPALPDNAGADLIKAVEQGMVGKRADVLKNLFDRTTERAFDWAGSAPKGLDASKIAAFFESRQLAEDIAAGAVKSHAAYLEKELSEGLQGEMNLFRESAESVVTRALPARRHVEYAEKMAAQEAADLERRAAQKAAEEAELALQKSASVEKAAGGWAAKMGKMPMGGKVAIGVGVAALATGLGYWALKASDDKKPAPAAAEGRPR